LLLLVEIGRALDEAGAEPSFHADPAVTDALAVVQRRFREDVNVASVAADVGVTPEHLITLVRRATGRTLGQWLTDRRMAEARRLLVSTDRPVEAVGRRSGYGDAAHFSRRFKQMCAIPPAAWRSSQR
jgi:AraC family transcriptional activator of pobA